MMILNFFVPFYKTPGFLHMLYFIFIVIVFFVMYVYVIKKRVTSKTAAFKDALEKSEHIQEQLEESLLRQQSLTREIIAQEKMASLGSMVAGISHEVNNPLGVCLTTITAFDQKVSKVTRAYEEERLSKTKFREFLQLASDCNQVIMTNIDNAILTINGFRAMAVNQMQDRTETIVLPSFFDTLKDGLKYELKKKQVQIEIICKNAIVFKGDPGALTQIFTNLILNSTFHGFKDQDNNIITIKLAVINNHLMIEYKDNGVGIPKEITQHIFNMFFTTRREEGGSGLGLHIVKNLLKEKFDGTITYEAGEVGVSFTIEIPLEKESY